MISTLGFAVSSGSSTRSLAGKWDRSFYSTGYIEDIKEWLLDENDCFTEWEPLLDIRAAQS